MRRLLLVVLVLAFVWPASAHAAPPVARAAATCDDYSNQADAQRAKDTRDADADGIYCEALPCPCLRPGEGDGGGGGAPAPKPRPRPKPKPKPKKVAKSYRARITSVVDGDTINVRLASGNFTSVRLIGIDTPETKNPEVPVECGGPEASSSMLALSFSAPEDTDGDGLLDLEGGQGRRVVLRTDPTQDTRDRYGRLLAYVTTRGGTLLQTGQLSAGWAKVDVFEGKAFQQLARFRKAQRSARVGSRGVWADCGGNFDRSAGDARARASVVRLCGDIVDIGVTPARIRVTNVSCRRARRLADRVSKVRRAPFNGCIATEGSRIRIVSCVRDGFRCRENGRTEYDGVKVLCTRRSFEVRFRLG